MRGKKLQEKRTVVVHTKHPDYEDEISVALDGGVKRQQESVWTISRRTPHGILHGMDAQYLGHNHITKACDLFDSNINCKQLHLVAGTLFSNN